MAPRGHRFINLKTVLEGQREAPYSFSCHPQAANTNTSFRHTLFSLGVWGIHLDMWETRGGRKRLHLLLSILCLKTSCFPTPLRQVLSPRLKFAASARLAGESAAAILLSPLPNIEVRDTCRHVLFLMAPGIRTWALCVHSSCSYPPSHFSAASLFFHGFWGSHSGPCVFKASILLTELFLHPLSDSFLNTFFFFRSC